MTSLTIANTIIFLAICVGVYFRRMRQYHVPIMASSFLLDMILLIIVETQNQAVKQAVNATGTILIIHIVASVISLLCYFALIITGIKKYRQTGGNSHKYFAMVFLLARFVNCFTSFMI